MNPLMSKTSAEWWDITVNQSYEVQPHLRARLTMVRVHDVEKMLSEFPTIRSIA
jgi:hypothetical protein